MAPRAKLNPPSDVAEKQRDQPVNVRLPRDLHAQALRWAEAEDRTLAQLVRVALRQYLAQLESRAGNIRITGDMKPGAVEKMVEEIKKYDGGRR